MLCSIFSFTEHSIALIMKLLQSITNCTFQTLSDLDAVHLLGNSFASELEWLKNATPTVESSRSASPTGALAPSYALYGAEYPEVNRTLTSMLAVKWLMAEDYVAFTGGQCPLIRLTPGSFQELRGLLLESCPCPESIYALLIAIAVNDLGKNNDLAELVTSITGQNFRDHDDVVYAAAKEHLFPSFESMRPVLYSDLLLGLELGSRLNIAQFAQAECVTASLKGVTIMSGRDRALAMKLMEVILDVAGASGHIDTYCAAQMTESVFQTFLVVHESLFNILSGQMSPEEGYNCVLLARAEMLRDAGFQRRLLINDPADRALTRLLTMGRVVDAERACCFALAFDNLTPETRQSLVNALNVDDTSGQVSILFSYAPAIISQALKNTKGNEHQMLVLSALMRFLARIYTHEKAHPGRRDCNVRDVCLAFAQETIKSDRFRKNPRLLDYLPIPIQR